MVVHFLKKVFLESVALDAAPVIVCLCNVFARARACVFVCARVCASVACRGVRCARRVSGYVCVCACVCLPPCNPTPALPHFRHHPATQMTPRYTVGGRARCGVPNGSGRGHWLLAAPIDSKAPNQPQQNAFPLSGALSRRNVPAGRRAPRGDAPRPPTDPRDRRCITYASPVVGGWIFLCGSCRIRAAAKILSRPPEDAATPKRDTKWLACSLIA